VDQGLKVCLMRQDSTFFVLGGSRAPVGLGGFVPQIDKVDRGHQAARVCQRPNVAVRLQQIVQSDIGIMYYIYRNHSIL